MALLRVPMHALLPPVHAWPIDVPTAARLAHVLRTTPGDLDPVEALRRDDGATWRLLRGRTVHAAYLLAGRREIPVIDGC